MIFIFIIKSIHGMIPAYMDSLPRENLSHTSANPIIKYKNETIPRYLRLLSSLGHDSARAE